MNRARTILALASLDARNVWRDSMLRWILIFPPVLVAAIVWALPRLKLSVMENYSIDLAPYDPLIAAGLLFNLPGTFGFVVGFLLLDQRDERTMDALRTSPLSHELYLAYRIGVPVLISTVASAALLPLTGLVDFSWAELLAASFSASLLTPLMALLLSAYASDKVQGFALMKIANAALLPVTIAYFVAQPWQWLFAVIPPFWAAKLVWMLASGQAGALLVFGAGLAYQAWAVAALARRSKAAQSL